MSELKKYYYQEQLKLYKEMFETGVDQEKAIRAKDYERLLSLIKKRKTIMEKIEKIKKKFSFFSKHPDKDIEVQEILQKLIFLLRKILTQAEENESLLRKGMQQISLDLQKINKAKYLQKAYRRFSQPNVHFLDQRK